MGCFVINLVSDFKSAGYFRRKYNFDFIFYMYYKENFLVGKNFKYLQIIIILLVNLYIRGGYVGKMMSEFKSRLYFRSKCNFEFFFTVHKIYIGNIL